MQVKEGE